MKGEPNPGEWGETEKLNSIAIGGIHYLTLQSKANLIGLEVLEGVGG